MKFTKYIVSAFIALASIVSCEKDNSIDITNEALKGKPVAFTLPSVNTKTEYSATDQYQIEWNKNDKITIYCYNAEKNTFDSAVYLVVDKEGTAADKANITKDACLQPVDADNQLCWQGTGEHVFYAVYGEGVTVNKKGVASLPWRMTSQSLVKKNDKYYAPDMNFQYMASYKKVSTPEDNVTLNFKPLMTTMDIKVCGHPSETRYINSITVSLPYKADASAIGCDLSKDGFPVNSVGNANSDIQLSLPSSKIALHAKESIEFSVILPRVNITSTNPVTIKVTAMSQAKKSYRNKATFKGDGKNDLAGSRIGVILPEWKDEKRDYENWQEELPDDIYLSMITIPGTNFSAAHAGSMQTQYLSIEDQLKAGVRAFTLKPRQDILKGTITYKDKRGKVQTKTNAQLGVFIMESSATDNENTTSEIKYQWMTEENDDDMELPNTISTDGVITMGHSAGLTNLRKVFDNFLAAHPREFIMLIVDQGAIAGIDEHGNTHDDAAYIFNGITKDSNGNDITKFYRGTAAKGVLNTWYAKANHHGALIPWEPDMTVDEARGNILFMTKENNTFFKKESALITSWPEGVGTSKITNRSNNHSSTAFYVQNINKVTDTDAKKNAITANYQRSAKRTGASADIKTWFMNNTAGYTGSSQTTESHANCAGIMNQHLNDILLDFDEKYGVPGPAGIVLIDFAGVDNIHVKKGEVVANGGTSYDVHGANLINTIVDHNYRYEWIVKGQ